MSEDKEIFKSLPTIVAQALKQMKEEFGPGFNLDKVNLAELERRTHVSRAKLRKLKGNGWQEKPHGSSGKKSARTVLTGYSEKIDELLRSGVTNSSVCFDTIKRNGYTGGLTTVKNYISSHMDLVPARRTVVDPQGNRGRRYITEPGKMYQMDWGFIKVTIPEFDESYRAACFAMTCHHCGRKYTEYFPNAKQENLFIGMIDAFSLMGVPEYVLTDNMASVVIGRDIEGNPIWNINYEQFMKAIGFETKLCKPRHPFTKGAVERLVRFVKENFIAGRKFYNISDLNASALEWCEEQDGKYHQCVDCIPREEHANRCLSVASRLVYSKEIEQYLSPLRRISFDGFVNYEGRRFGVPCWYTKNTCRVRRSGDVLHIYDSDLTQEIVSHEVTWSKRDRFCKDQYVTVQPEEHPTAPVGARSILTQVEVANVDDAYDKFNFDREDLWK